MASTDDTSLYSLAKNVLIKYVNTIEDVGPIEYRILEPVLKKIRSPLQLKKLEENSPQIADEDKELWKKFIARDFGIDAVDKWIPKNPRSWSKIYDKHQRETELASARAAENLKAQFAGLSSSKESSRTHLVQASSLPPVRRSKAWGSGGGGGSSWSSSANNWDAKTGSKTKNIVQRARREAKELARFRGGNSKLAVPTNQLRRVGTVSMALTERIKTAEGLRGDTDGGLKRKSAPQVVDDDEEEQEDFESKRTKTQEWLKKAGENRGAMVRGPQQKVMVERKTATDPFFRPKKRV